MEKKEKDSIPPPLTITPAAAESIRKVMDSERVPEGYFLRVGVRSQGLACAGMSYLLGFDSKKDADLSYVIDGIPVLIDRRQSMYVLGMEIDWHADEERQGFVFNNPKARKPD